MGTLAPPGPPPIAAGSAVRASPPPAAAAAPPQRPGRTGLTSDRFFFWVVVAGAVASYLTIVAGAVVRVTGSGLGCPDWPTCHGRLIPPLEPEPMIEYTHRLAAAITSLLIFAVPAMAWLWHRQRRVLVPATLVPLLLAVQIPLGAVVVWLELPVYAVLVHLGFAVLILGTMTWLAVWAAPAAGRAPATTGRDHYRTLVTATAGLLLALILTGAFTRPSWRRWPG